MHMTILENFKKRLVFTKAVKKKVILKKLQIFIVEFDHKIHNHRRITKETQTITKISVIFSLYK